MVDAVDQEGQPQHVREEDEFLDKANSRVSYSHTIFQYFRTATPGGTYIPHIATDLAARDEEGQTSHPLVGAEAGLARKIVQVGDQPRHDVLEASIAALGVDADCVGRDIVDGEVEERRR